MYIPVTLLGPSNVASSLRWRTPDLFKNDTIKNILRTRIWNLNVKINIKHTVST